MASAGPSSTYVPPKQQPRYVNNGITSIYVVDVIDVKSMYVADVVDLISFITCRDCRSGSTYLELAP